MGALSAHFGKADLASVGGIYGADSVVAIDGTPADGPAAIAEFYKMRFAGGPVGMKIISTDAQFTPDAASPKLLVLVTGDTGSAGKAAARFQQLFILGPTPAGGMYIRTELLRFGPGATPFFMARDPGGMGAAFAKSYYETYAVDPARLAVHYRDSSQLSFEGMVSVGAATIAAKLPTLPRGKHELQTLDVVPVGKAGAPPECIMVMVTGRITLEGQVNPMPFMQTFCIMPDAAGALYISNELYRFVYG